MNLVKQFQWSTAPQEHDNIDWKERAVRPGVRRGVRFFLSDSSEGRFFLCPDSEIRERVGVKVRISIKHHITESLMIPIRFSFSHTSLTQEENLFSPIFRT